MRLTDEIKRYRWRFLDNDFEYNYTDWDEATLDGTGKKSRREKRIELGRPRYDITFQRIPEGRKRPVTVYLEFDDNGEHTNTDCISSTVTHKQVKAWESEAIKWLTDHGFVTEGE